MSDRGRYRIEFADGTSFETNQVRVITHGWINRYDGAIRFGFSTSRQSAETGAARNARTSEERFGAPLSTEITDKVKRLA
jgi:hypothetical protein